MSTPKSPAVVTVDLDEHELATVLSALRWWQCYVEKHGHAPIADHFSDGAIPLTSEEIDSLCEQINCAEIRAQECTCLDRSWYGKEHDSACAMTGIRYRIR